MPNGPPHAQSPHKNGRPAPAPVPAKAVGKVEEFLGQSFAAGYRPNLPIYSFRSQQVLGWEFFQDIEVMRREDCVALPLNLVNSTMAFAEWDMKGSTAEAAMYAARLLLWFWRDALYPVLDDGSSYGWCPAEILMEPRDGYVYPTSIECFSPRDAVPIIDEKTKKPTGIQIVSGSGMQSDGEMRDRRMWGFRENVPNKAFWYTHMPRYGNRFGESQIRGAWKPWRRLAGIDGVQEVMDIAGYRLGTGVIKVLHPNEMVKATNPALPGYAQGRGQVHSSQVAREISGEMKAGAGIALSSEVWDQKAGGNRKWDVLVETFQTNIQDLLAMEGQLEKKCAKAIGVPPELIAAAETGSGYSGRAIPLQGFLTTRQRCLHDLTKQVMAQLVNPLVKWCIGPDAWAEATPKPLIKSYRKAALSEAGGDEQGAEGSQPGQAGPQAANDAAGKPPFAQTRPSMGGS